jgi:hypothetical protein
MTKAEEHATVPAVARARELAGNERAASLMGLLALSMVMIRSDDEQHILHLATTTVGSISDCHVEALLIDGVWRLFGSDSGEAARRDLQKQVAVLPPDGGAINFFDAGWGCAYSLHSRGGASGYLIVGGDTEPDEYQQYLLRTLVQQMSVALASARLHLQSRVFANDLEASNRALQRSMDVHDRFAEAAWSEAGQDGIAQAVHELTGHPIAVEDRHGNLRAWAGPGRPTSYPKEPPGQRERLLADLERARTPIRHGDRLMVLARPATGLIGLLALIDPDRTAGPTDVVILEHARTVLAMELIRLQRLADSQQQRAGDLLATILDGAGQDVALDRAQALGYDLQRAHRIMIVASENPAIDGEAVLGAVRLAARESQVGSALVVHSGNVVLLSDSEDNWDSFQALLRSALSDGCRIGAGGLRQRWQDLGDSYQEARLALKLQKATSRLDRIVSFEDLGIFRLLGQVQDPKQIEDLIERWLGPLLENDTHHATPLVETLHAYLECGGSYDATARELLIHRSTLRYRLQRIKDISGHDLSDPDTRFNLQLSTRAWRTLQSLRDD